MFLKKLDALEEALAEKGDDVLQKGTPFLGALKSFSLVVESCFSTHVMNGFESHIFAFKDAYLKLGISVTPKVK